MHHNFNEKALELHAQGPGKIATEVIVPMSTREDLSTAYTPGVAEVCLAIARDETQAYSYTIKRNTVAIVTDGSAVLGLGNIGALASLPVMEGKAAILKTFASVDAFPVPLATQDTEEIIATVKRIAPSFGAINLEDISAPRCFEIESRLRAELDIPIMHDDQWGTATVVLAGMINALSLRGLSKEEARVIISGVGAAGVAIARLLYEYGITDIRFCDSKGIIHSERNDLTEEKRELIGRSTADVLEGSLSDGIKNRNVFIGVSKKDLLTGEMVQAMERDPIIFALANPTPEIMPEIAKEAGAFIVATGRSDYPNQLNNALVFPGLFRGVLDNNSKQFSTPMFVRAATALASSISSPSRDKILPSIFEKHVVEVVAKSVVVS